MHIEDIPLNMCTNFGVNSSKNYVTVSILVHFAICNQSQVHLRVTRALKLGRHIEATPLRRVHNLESIA